MSNKGTILIDLWKNVNDLSVKAQFFFSTKTQKDLIFYIADGFTIDKITVDEQTIEYNVSQEALEFRAATKKIHITHQGFKNLTVVYHGNMNGWHTLYEEDILAVNYYTAWYPTDVSYDMDYLVKIHLDHTYFVVNGEYDSDEKVWYYKPLDFDVNILALKNYELIQSENVSLYYFDKANLPFALPYFENYNHIIDYYTALYGHNKTGKTNIVILPKGNKYDGYLRKSLIVFGGIREDYDSIVHLLAHELAHAWCSGAKADTWEDWMNETFAEWSALLYELEITGNTIKFDKIIADKEKSFPTLKPVKTEDNRRPEGVHDNGVLHLHKLFCTYGVDAIKTILKTFDSLPHKTTDNLIQKLKENEDTIVANYISNMLT
ncbi:hypothetical protein I5677_14760 [Mobilitalea sibirica]|uniref:Peptidase M1 membrane alanine aminopeptidase domain-containing protein n=1 Tax=Mobilitalea sibirica TaxID=1462919 RepID=A0A8J7HCJ7_9FIRM|nr:hypothetical protein [Mobilitalea sibirica]MBH1942161.1 hypothetical protein [Mobilitalea sibirica]